MIPRLSGEGVAPMGPLVSKVSVAVQAPATHGSPPVLSHLHCSGALAARLTPDGVILVGAGAHPIGDDSLVVDVVVGDGADLAVRSSGATLARRGAADALSEMMTTASVGADATLRWLVEPGIAAFGARHRSRTVVELARSSRLVWREEVVLGRFGEEVPGSWRASIDLRRDGRALYVGELDLGPAAPSWGLQSVLDGARAVVSILVVDPERDEGDWHATTVSSGAARGVSLCLAGPGVELVAWGESLGDCRSVTVELERQLELDWLTGETTS